MGELLGEFLRGAIGEGLERLDRKAGGLLTWLVLACAVLACVVTSLGQEGGLMRLAPVTLAAALLAGVVVLIRWRLGVNDAPAEAEAVEDESGAWTNADEDMDDDSEVDQ
jgi:hypothetical protein